MIKLFILLLSLTTINIYGVTLKCSTDKVPGTVVPEERMKANHSYQAVFYESIRMGCEDERGNQFDMKYTAIGVGLRLSIQSKLTIECPGIDKPDERYEVFKTEVACSGSRSCGIAESENSACRIYDSTDPNSGIDTGYVNIDLRRGLGMGISFGPLTLTPVNQ